ncbi:MAG: 50S ribosomal protein L29 [Alphaproteobacteria bacterium]|jgi:large subunit ribosomal protein L29|nr:50S ribosomal protein L29 [Candidatus Jidaibacter sp.]
MKASELRIKTVSELVEQVVQLRKEQFNQRFQRAAKESVNPARVRSVRKLIAKIKTILNEKKMRGDNA